MTLSLTFAQSFFEQNVSVQLNLLRFIFILSDICDFEIKPEMGDVLAKMRECGKFARMRDFPHDCGTVDTYDMVRVSLGLGSELGLGLGLG